MIIQKSIIRKGIKKQVLHFLQIRAGALSFLLLFAFSIAGATPPVAGPAAEPIELVPGKLPFNPKEFYIANVIDEREDPSAVVWLVPNGYKAGQAVAHQKIDLKGGGQAAIQAFIQKSLPSNSKLRPVSIRLKKCKITETPGEKGGVNGQIKLVMDFEYERKGESVHLTSYSGGARYTRAPGKITLIEPALRQSLTSALTYFNNWIEREADTNIKLAKGVKVFITDFTDNSENDTVFHSPDRPLVWDDFQGQPRGGKYAAAVFTSFSYEGGSEVKDGYVHLNLQMKVYIIKSSSWVRSSSRDAYSLNHEQRHFDIVKGVVERFKQKLKSESFEPDDFDRVIATLYIDAYREMNRLQDQYDRETQHGLATAVQEQWNRKIDDDLLKR